MTQSITTPDTNERDRLFAEAVNAAAERLQARGRAWRATQADVLRYLEFYARGLLTPTEYRRLVGPRP